MDIEFHYHMTYLIAARAGYSPKEASTIAHASQLVDDNQQEWEISGAPDGTPYTSMYSQSINAFRIVDPDRERKLFPVYMAFHFIPGDPERVTAWREDGRMHLLNTTPNGLLARMLMKRALQTGNLHRIGVASHAYADTWAHQNFTGHYDSFNALNVDTPLSIGHAMAGRDPDPPGHTWTDPRLVGHLKEVDNTERCLQAARHLFHLYRLAQPQDRREKDQGAALAGLEKHLRQAIGSPADGPEAVERRKERYGVRATRKHYRAHPMPEYSPEAWFEEAVEKTAGGKRDWKDPAAYRETDWFQFQEAVKKHFALAWSLFSAALEDRMDLKLPAVP